MMRNRYRCWWCWYWCWANKDVDDNVDIDDGFNKDVDADVVVDSEANTDVDDDVDIGNYVNKDVDDDVDIDTEAKMLTMILILTLKPTQMLMMILI